LTNNFFYRQTGTTRGEYGRPAHCSRWDETTASRPARGGWLSRRADKRDDPAAPFQQDGLYSSIDRPSIDPELMIRLLLIGRCSGIRWSGARAMRSTSIWPAGGSAGSLWMGRCRITRNFQDEARMVLGDEDSQWMRDRAAELCQSPAIMLMETASGADLGDGGSCAAQFSLPPPRHVSTLAFATVPTTCPDVGYQG